jgi:hypothetical protein
MAKLRRRYRLSDIVGFSGLLRVYDTACPSTGCQSCIGSAFCYFWLQTLSKQLVPGNCPRTLGAAGP